MASKWIKNDSGSDKTWIGQLVTSGSYYQIQDAELISWQNDSTLLSDIGSGDAVVAKDDSGNEDITDVADALNYLKDIQTATDTDGVPLSRTKITRTGWHFQLHGFEFETSKLNSVYSKDVDGNDLGISTIKYYNGTTELVAGTQAELDSSCDKTVITWQPPQDVEVIGGILEQSTPPTTNVRMWVTALPDYTVAQGGSIPFTQGGINLRRISGALDLDGKTPKLLPYNGGIGTNKFQITIRHDTGTQHPIHMLFKLFRENV